MQRMSKSKSCSDDESENEPKKVSKCKPPLPGSSDYDESENEDYEEELVYYDFYGENNEFPLCLNWNNFLNGEVFTKLKNVLMKRVESEEQLKSCVFSKKENKNVHNTKKYNK